MNVQKLMNGNVFRKWRAQGTLDSFSELNSEGLYIDTIKNLCVELESVGFFKRVQGDSSRNPYWVTASDLKWDLQAYLVSFAFRAPTYISRRRFKLLMMEKKILKKVTRQKEPSHSQ